MKIKTIDINAKEWFDKVNGNRYFSGTITLNYGTRTTKEFLMPFQYGYGEHYIDMANQFLIKEKIITNNCHENGTYPPLWRYCKDNKIILRTSKKENCKKRDVETANA